MKFAIYSNQITRFHALVYLNKELIQQCLIIEIKYINIVSF
jgi:hypothetical protein